MISKEEAIKYYNDLIIFRRSNPLFKSKKSLGSVETHHIIPTSCGGQNTSENKINFLSKEHFMAHVYLWIIHHDDEYHSQTTYALSNMIRGTLNGSRSDLRSFILESEEYQKAKEESAILNSQTIRSKIKGDKNGMFNKKWIYNPISKEQKIIDKNDSLPNGWKYGRTVQLDNDTRQKTNKNLLNVSGMIKAYNPISFETHYYKSIEDVPNGFIRGNPPLEKKYSIEETQNIKKKISENTIKAIWKDRDYNAVVELYRKMYKVYLEEGFEEVCIQFNYDKSQQNLVQRFRRYLPEYKGYQRNKSNKKFSEKL